MEVGNATPGEDYFQLTNKLVLKHINILYGRVPFSLSAAMSWNNHWLCFLQLSKAFHSWNKCGTKYHESKRNIPYNESSEFVALRFREFTSSLNGEIKEKRSTEKRENRQKGDRRDGKSRLSSSWTRTRNIAMIYASFEQIYRSTSTRYSFHFT